MKDLIIYLSAIVCACLSLVSCNEDTNSVVPSGILYLSVEEDATLLTKAAHEVTYESLLVAILKEEGDTLKVYGDYLTEVKGERLVLPVGAYMVAVRSTDADGVGWEKPLYQGSKEVEVKQGEITNVQVICKIANTKVSVEYGESVKDYFIDYQTTVSTTSGGKVVFTRDEYRSAYFPPEKLTVQLDLVNLDGNEFTIKKVYPDIKPQYHYIFKFTLDDPAPDEDGGLDFDLSIDDERQIVEYKIFIKEEELFGKGEPILKLGQAFDNKNTVKISKKEGSPIPEDAQLKLIVPNGIESARLNVSSWQMDGSYDLSNWPAQFPVLDLEETEQELDLTSLLEYLQPEGLQISKHQFTLAILDKLHQETSLSFTVEVKADVPILLYEPIVWAKFATLRGTTADETGQKFMFKKQEETEYTEISDVQVDSSTGDVTALVQGLDPNTTYEYYLVSGEDGANQSEPLRFTTDDAPIVPNLSFDDWCESGGVKYPNANQNNAFWDSGNGGAKTAGLTPTEPTEQDVIKGKAAYLHTEWAAITLAAGNIYSGSFKKAIISLTNPGAELDFGRPYTGRPTKLSGYYKYLPKKVDKGRHGELNQGDMDKCCIYIVLCDWKTPFTANTQTGTFVNMSADYVLAYGELSDAEASRTDMDKYERFEIDIKYRDTERKPSYILIVASSSKYGDYFTGGVGSSLYLDEFELSFDYNEKSFE